MYGGTRTIHSLSTGCVRWLACTAIAALLAVTGCAGPDPAPQSPRARKGVLDLRTWDFAAAPIVRLDGPWEFYWNTFLAPGDFSHQEAPEKTGYLDVHDFWEGYRAYGTALKKDGMATIRLTVYVDPGSPPLALDIHSMPAAYRLWFNDRLLAEQGTVGGSKEQERPSFGEKVVFLQPSGEQFQLILQLSNHTVFWQSVPHPAMLLGPASHISQGVDDKRRLKAMLLAVTLFMAVYHLVLYLAHRRDRSTLYFGLFCLLWFINGSTGYISNWLMPPLEPYISVWMMYRIDFISYIFSVPLITLFFRSMFTDEIPVWLPRFALAMATLFSLYLLMPESTGLHPLEGTGIKYFHLVTLIVTGWCALCLIRAWLRKRKEATLIMAGFVLMALFAVNDILHDMHVIRTGFFMPVGMVLFIIIQSFVLARRFSRTSTTAERLSHELLEKNIALSKMDQLKDEFLANTSHELRTPLMGIIGISESLLSGRKETLSPEVTHNLTMIAESGRRLNALVNDILDFTKIRNRELPLHIKSVDARAVAEVVITALTPLAGARNLTLVNTIPAGLPPVKADEDRLQQIFYNLLGNGIKFSDHGEITVGGRTLDHGYLELSVRDRGIGIPEDRLQAVFEPFEQVGGGADRSFQGVGLGLAITRNLVHLHGGELSVESRVNEGSTFRFTLPQSDASPETESQAEPPAPFQAPVMPRPRILPPSAGPGTHSLGDSGGEDTAPARILVVDDEPVNLQVVVNHLHNEGFSVQFALSGSQALPLLESDPPDLVLLDIMMPQMTGYEVCRHLRRTYSISQMPVIMLSAKNRITDIVEGFAAGANDYLTKPFVKDELLARVDTQLKLRQAYRTLAENVRLKKELASRQQTEQALRLTQRRLSQLLDTVDDMVISINECREVSFCNQPAASLFDSEIDDLLGRSIDRLFDSGGIDIIDESLRQQVSEEAETPMPRMIQDMGVLAAGSGRIRVEAVITTLQMENERLLALIIRPAGDSSPSASPAVGKTAALNVIEEVNRHQERLRGLENALNGLLPTLRDSAPEIVKEIRSLDQALDDVQNSLKNGSDIDRRRLGVVVMQLSLDYWYEATDLDKAALARESGIWKIYTDHTGYTRTQTLDKYLNDATLPKRPRWQWISRTALFVLSTCTTPSLLRDRLEEALSLFRLEV